MILQLDSVTKRFGGLVALDTISIDVEEGGVTAVIGPNGAGKTTLFNVVSGVFRPDEGAIRFRGRDISGVAPATIAELGLVRTFQLVKLFPDLSSRENVMVGRHLRTRGGVLSAVVRPGWARREEAEVGRVARELLEMVGLGDLGDTPASALPYGQQRLLEIARALAAEPTLLLLDEPAAGLGRDESSRLGKLIRRIADRGTTIFLIEHDMPLVMNIADKVIVLDFGKFVAEGTPEAVQRNPAVIAAYLGGTELEDA